MKKTKSKRPRSAAAAAKGPRRREFPPHLRCDTPEEWRAIKRQEWREVMYALNKFRYGSAYVPAHNQLYDLDKLAVEIEEAMNAEGWIAW